MKKLVTFALAAMTFFGTSAFAEEYTIKKGLKIPPFGYTKADTISKTKMFMQYYTSLSVHLCTALFDTTKPYPIMGMKVDIKYKNKKDGLYLDSFAYRRELLCKPKPVLRVALGTEPMQDLFRAFITIRKNPGVNDEPYKGYIRTMAINEREYREKVAFNVALYCGMVGESPPYPYAYTFLTATYVNISPFRMVSRYFMKVDGWNWYGFVECFRTKKERDEFARIQSKRFGVEVK